MPNLTNVTIADSVTSIGSNMFGGCARLTTITIPDSVTNIGEYAFYYCGSLTNVTISDSVTGIGEAAFENCTRLTSVTIPGSVTSIGDGAFWDCSSLKDVFFLGNAPAPGYIGFFDASTRAYYLPGTEGWSTNFDGIPTALWTLPNPMILNNSMNFGVQPGGFSFTVAWASNATVVVEASTNLATQEWRPQQTNTIIATNGTFYFSDPEWTNYPGRFYRIVAQ